MKKLLLAGVAIVATMAISVSSHAAVYFSQSDWFNAANIAGNASTAIVQMPAQSLVLTDSFGQYVPGISRTLTIPEGTTQQNASAAQFFANSLRYSPSDDAGQLSGSFGCASPVYPCLGAYTTTYTLPFAITGISGFLNYNTGGGNLVDIGFLGIPSTGITGRGDFFRYTGEWGTIFDAPTDTFSITWGPGLRSTDNSASFVLNIAVVLTAPGVVTVPEPASLALFGAGLLGLGMVRRRKGATSA